LKVIRNIYLSRLFFLLFFVGVLLFALSSVAEWLLYPAQIGLLSLIGLTLIDAILVFSSTSPVALKRQVNERLNLGDKNTVKLEVLNTTNQPISFRLYEGFPVEMQERKLFFSAIIASGKKRVFSYEYIPKQRGTVQFNDAFFIISSLFHLVMRRHEVPSSQTIGVYPSVLQLKKYELLVFHQQKINSGIKRLRRLGNNSEFEQIKDYVQGDEVKTINWKATSRTANLMVNKYQEEKSQSVFCVLDKSRSMQMEFEGLSLLDYSINSILVLSNIMLRNGDKTGLITFSDKMGIQLPAEKSKGQMRFIMEALYNQKTEFKEPNYELLYQTIRRTVKTRSLIVLFTNFETEAAMNRALPVLRKINQKHVLVTVLFQNSDLETLALQKPESMREIYQTIVAEQMSELKSKIAFQLKQNGIQTVLTLPENLSLQSINKYLELKAKGML